MINEDLILMREAPQMQTLAFERLVAVARTD
jgi:hypothetical protein